MNTPTDYFQQPLSVGDRIVYPVSRGSSGVGLAEASIDLVEELVPNDPNDPECRYGYKYSERLKPPHARTSLELPLRYVLYPAGIQRQTYSGTTTMMTGRYEYDPTKLFKLRVKNVSHDGTKIATKTTWIKNVDRVIRAPEAVQS